MPHRHLRAASRPSGWGLEVTHGEASQSQELDLGVLTALFPGSFTVDCCLPTRAPQRKWMEGKEGRGGRKAGLSLKARF